MGRVQEYLKLSRSFNAGLTGVAPVMGAVSMGEERLFVLILLFLVGFFGHVYGFVLNDIIDLKIDKKAQELTDRPLVSGTITLRAAWLFTASSLVISLILGVLLAMRYYSFLPALPLLLLSALSITIYDIISKKWPAMDIFVGAGVLLLIIYGAISVDAKLTDLAWIVVALGTLQVFFMQFIAGGLKDAENDSRMQAKTLAVALGVRVEQGRVSIPLAFKSLAHSLQAIDIALLFVPLLFIFDTNDVWLHMVILGVLSCAMVAVSVQLLHMKTFDRNRVRTFIGLHYFINFSLVPIMLTAINPLIGLLALVPFGAFLLSNISLHGTLLQPQTM